VQKIFFTVAGTFVYLYLFLSVRASHHQLRHLTSHPTLTFVIVASGGFLLVLVGRLVWSKVKKLWRRPNRAA